MPFLIERRNTRTKSIALALLAPATALLAACGGESTSPNPPPPPPAETWSTVVQRSWTLPSVTEAYQCHSELAATDKYYTGFRLASPPAAQTELYLTVRPSVAQVGDFDCDFGSLAGGELIYAAGSGTTAVTFAGGKGVHVAAGQYVVLIEHLHNTSASPVTATTTIEGRVAAAKDVTTPIDMFFAGRLAFTLDASADTIPVNGSCGTLADMHIVAEIPILRALGVHQTFTVTDAQHASHKIFDSSFDVQHMIYTSLGSDFLVVGSSYVNATCSYVNTTGVVVNLGESASDESCLLGVYRYPPKPATATSPVECAMGIPV